jgi:hypothetical protein
VAAEISVFARGHRACGVIIAIGAYAGTTARAGLEKLIERRCAVRQLSSGTSAGGGGAL